MENGGNEAKTNGSGQSVIVQIGDKNFRWLIIAVLVFVGIMLFTNRTASQAELKANQAIKTSEDAQTEKRVMTLWLTQASASCEKAGISMPPIPAVLLK